MDRDTAAEVFQEVWIKIIRAKDRYRSTAKFTTYMYQLAHNCFIDHVRVQRRTPSANRGAAVVDPSEIAGPAMDNPGSRAEQGKSLERFRRALAGLPAEQREAFVLREESGLSLADIAAVTGVTPETAKSRLRYAVNKLRIMLSDMETSA
jgi:RNA polymerase sigma-70 factor (ECF subfamily)